MAFDNYFEFVIYDFTTERNIFESRMEEELPDEIGEMYVESLNLVNGRIELNVYSKTINFAKICYASCLINVKIIA